jgi:DNA repair exonuclease SbcCD ATPase subunit
MSNDNSTSLPEDSSDKDPTTEIPSSDASSEAAAAQSEPLNTEAQAFVAAPAVPPQSAPAVPPVTVDERAYAQYQVIAQAVIESAENATRSAQAAAEASREMRQTTSSVMSLGQANYKRNQIMFAAGAGLLFISLIFFTVMGVRMISRINALDAMVLAVGKRAVELNVGLEGLSNFQQNMQDLSNKQAELRKSQAQLESRIDASLKQSEALANTLAQKVPSETAKQVASSSNALIKQVESLNGRLQSQASAVQNLGTEIKALKSANANVDTLKRDVAALITLQKERYLETMQKNNADQKREQSVQFPRKDNKPLELTPRPQ